MTLGDSITRATCWRAQLWQRLEQAHSADFDLVGTLQSDSGCSPSSYDHDNQGYSSALVTEIVAGITHARTCDPTCPTLDDLGQAFTSARPDIVLMHFGTNDVWNGIAPATILSAYTRVIDCARAANPSVRFLVAQIIPMNPSGCSACAARVQALDAEIPGWAAGKATAASPITVVDQWTGFDDSTDTGDGVHPNAQGAQKMSDKWFGALDPLF
jgi:lysophospholipase L1-like esterase